jgi:hypothetical protein
MTEFEYQTLTLLVSAGLIASILLAFVSQILRDPVPSPLLQCALRLEEQEYQYHSESHEERNRQLES